MFAFLLPLRSLHFGLLCPGGMLLGKVRGKEHLSPLEERWEAAGRVVLGLAW